MTSHFVVLNTYDPPPVKHDCRLPLWWDKCISVEYLRCDCGVWYRKRVDSMGMVSWLTLRMKRKRERSTITLLESIYQLKLELAGKRDKKK